MVNEKPRVLIVDDDQVVCELLCGELEEHGYLCATALSGNDALSKLVTGLRRGFVGYQAARNIWDRSIKGNKAQSVPYRSYYDNHEEK